jgi:hypothetical protein
MNITTFIIDSNKGYKICQKHEPTYEIGWEREFFYYEQHKKLVTTRATVVA